MINILVADDNLYFSMNLINYINKNNESIRVCCIAKDGKEALKMLNEEKNIDIVLLDYKMPLCDRLSNFK